MPTSLLHGLADTLFEAFENADIGVVVAVDRGDRLDRVYLNEAAARLTGYTRAEILAMGAAEILAPDARAELRHLREDIGAERRFPESFETVVVHKDGHHVPIHVGLARARHEGRPCAVAFVRDLTAEHAARDALAASERRFRELSERAPDSIVVATDGRIVYANPAAVRIMGYPSVAELSAKRFDELVVPGDLERLHDRHARIARGEHLPPAEYRMRRADGTIVHLEITSLATHFEGRSAVVACGRDVSERRALLDRALQQDRLAAAGTLAAGAAHEINNPLTYVLLNLELLRLQAENAGPRGALSLPLLDEALAGTQRVARIVQDLLALARPSEEVWEVVHVEDVASAAVRLASTTCGSSLRVDTRLDGLPPVRTNGARLGQVLLNLVVNALQALRGHADPRVTLSGTVQGDRVVLALDDNGPGIPAAILPRVYDPFFTTKAPGHGAGLGLTVSHAIVTTLGGTLRVTSDEGRGTTVYVELPVGTPQEAPAPTPNPSPAAAAPTTRVLLVDDEQAVTRVLTALLGDTHQTTACHDPAQALTLLATDRRWDAVICDLRMPGLSGAALYTRVKQLDPVIAARFVFTTGGALENADADIVAESGRPLLAKPFTRKRLLAAIDTVIAGGRASAAV